MTFRLQLPLGRARATFRACADGQFGAVIKAYREWKISGDTAWLASHWREIKSALAFAWSEANADRWDRDRDGVLEGRQHHTLDMELFGPNSWLTGFYLAALKAGSRDGGAPGRPRCLGRVPRAVRARAPLGGRAPVQRRVLLPEDRSQGPLDPRELPRGRRAHRRGPRRLLGRGARRDEVPGGRRLHHRPGARPVAREHRRARPHLRRRADAQGARRRSTATTTRRASATWRTRAGSSRSTTRAAPSSAASRGARSPRSPCRTPRR